MAKERTCSCPASVYGGFKQGVGIFLGGMVVVGAPIFLLIIFALPAYLGSLSRAAAAGAQGTGTQSTTPTSLTGSAGLRIM